MPASRPKFINQEWLAQNALRAYPLADDAGETDTTGAFVLPRSLLVDAIFVINQELSLNQAGFFLSNVTAFGNGVTLTFSYDSGTSVSIFGSASVSASGHTRDSSYFIQGQGSFEGMVGVVTIGTLEATLSFGGSFDFDLTGGRLLPTVLRPDTRGVKSVQAINGSDIGPLLYGDVILEAGQNVRLSVQDVGGGELAIRFDALSGSDLNATCGCDNEVQLGPPIRTLNGVPPRTDGSFTLANGTCIAIVTGGGSGAAATLSINDTCSKPCCGTPELDIVRTDMEQLNQDTRSVLHLLQRLESYLLQLNTLSVAVQNTGLLGSNETETDPV
jgi:hypothetical protein